MEHALFFKIALRPLMEATMVAKLAGSVESLAFNVVLVDYVFCFFSAFSVLFKEFVQFAC